MSLFNTYQLSAISLVGFLVYPNPLGLKLSRAYLHANFGQLKPHLQGIVLSYNLLVQLLKNLNIELIAKCTATRPPYLMNERCYGGSLFNFVQFCTPESK